MTVRRPEGDDPHPEQEGQGQDTAARRAGHSVPFLAPVLLLVVGVIIVLVIWLIF